MAKKPTKKAAAKKTTANKSTAATPEAISRKESTRFQAEDDIRTLQRADEIRGSSARMRAAKAQAEQQVKALKKVTT